MASEADKLATLAVIRNKIASCDPNSSRYNYYIKQYKAFGGVVSGESNVEDSGELNNSSWMVNQSQQLKKLSNYVSEGIAQAAGSVSLGISNVGESAISEIQDWKAQMNQTLKPMGMGSAIGDMTELVKNPLGAPQFLTNSVIALVDKINPGFTNEMDAAYKANKLDNLQHLPSKMMGSVRNLATAADAILSVPFEIMSDVYNGLMDIMESISDTIDGIMSAVTDFFFGPDGLLDSIFPISELLELFSAVGELASFVGGISQMTGGFAAVTDIAGQVQSYASSASSALSNPLQLAIAYIPPQATSAFSQGMGALRNPEQLLQSALPPEISQQMQNISQIPGLGFVGNLGFSVGDTLDSLSDGVFTAALDQFADKAGILGPLFNKQTTPPDVDNQEAYTDAFAQSKVKENQQTAQGITQIADTSSYKVLPTTDKPELGVQDLSKSSSARLMGEAPKNPWPSKVPIGSGTGPTVELAKNLKPAKATTSITMPAQQTTLGIPGGTVTIPSAFSMPNQPLRF